MSAITGIGDVTRDKRMTHAFGPGCRLTYQQIAQMWETDGIAAKAVEAHTEEIFRAGYDLDIPDEGRHADLKEYVKTRLRELGVNRKVATAYQYKRAYGGGALLLGTGDSKGFEKPLNLDEVRSLEFINVLEPMEIYPVQNYDDPFHAKYGEPEYFQVDPFQGLASFGGPIKKENRPIRGSTYIHESRLIIFRGIRTSNYYLPNTDISPFWGASIFPRFIDKLRDLDVASSGLGILMVDPAQPVVTIPTLLQKVGKDEKALRDRFAAIELGRSIARIIALGKDEKYERQVTNMTGLPDIWDRLSLITSATMDIPLSILLGYSPATLGTPDKDERKQWFNKCRSIETNELEDPLTLIIRLIMQSRRQRGLPKHWRVAWNDLEHLTTTERVMNQKTQSETDMNVVKAGMAFPDELRRSRYKGGYSHETQIDESKKAPGFMAPLPPGVMPGSTPAVSAKPGAPVPMGPNAHSVSGYARRNPTAPAAVVTKPHGDENYTAAAEVEYTRAALERARAESDARVPALEQLLAIAEQEAAACAAGTCGPDCNYDHPRRVDEDGPGKRVTFAGLPVVLESPKGSIREWIDTDGTPGKTTMKYDYGYIPGTLGTDGDSVDVYLGPSENATWVYLIDQMAKSTGFQTFDEQKVMLGFDSPNHARDAYLRQYDDERFFGGMTQMTLDDFRRKLVLAQGEQITTGS